MSGGDVFRSACRDIAQREKIRELKAELARVTAERAQLLDRCIELERWKTDAYKWHRIAEEKTNEAGKLERQLNDALEVTEETVLRGAQALAAGDGVVTSSMIHNARRVLLAAAEGER